MTNAVAQDKGNSKVAFIITIAIFAVLGFAMLFTIAYDHSDGTPYSMGYEMGRLLGDFLSFKTLKNGIGLGTLIAIHCSWERNKSILWAILHAVFGWAYVIYYAITRKSK